MVNMMTETARNSDDGRHDSVSVNDSIEDTLSALSHDLRSPLAAVHLHIEAALRRVPASAAEMAPPLRRASKIVKETVLLVEKILTEARDSAIARRPADASDRHVDLREVIHTCVSMHGPALSAAGCSITVRCEGNLEGGWPRGALFQVLSNLISNATKYAPGHAVHVHAARCDRTIVLGVSDDGPGFSAREQARAFERFRREPRAGNQTGFGLGLWIARRAVERLGGTIRLVSAPGQGALFLIELPLDD
jgi:signal transduction histidine kinase